MNFCFWISAPLCPLKFTIMIFFPVYRLLHTLHCGMYLECFWFECTSDSIQSSIKPFFLKMEASLWNWNSKSKKYFCVHNWNYGILSGTTRLADWHESNCLQHISIVCIESDIVYQWSTSNNMNKRTHYVGCCSSVYPLSTSFHHPLGDSKTTCKKSTKVTRAASNKTLCCIYI